jgi:hypothetical protein
MITSDVFWAPEVPTSEPTTTMLEALRVALAEQLAALDYPGLTSIGVVLERCALAARRSAGGQANWSPSTGDRGPWWLQLAARGPG